MLAWDALSELDAYRITEIPRRADPGPAQPPSAESDDAGRTQRLAALVAAYHGGIEAEGGGSAALVIGWVRHDTDGPVQVLAAGPGLVGSDAGEEVFLALPGGARAQPLGRGSLTGLMAKLPAWRAIGGISDGLLPADDRHAAGRPAPSLEECLLAAWPGPFGWLLVAEPLSAGEIGRLADELAQREQYATGDSDRFPGRATAARRLSLRHAEMRKGASAGMWRVRLLAGGADAGAAARVTGLVCASADLSGLPYALAPAGGAARGLPEALDDPNAAGTSPAGGDAAAGHPFYASSELVATLTRPPEREMPGIRLALRPDFDVTQEPAAGRAAITVGEILDLLQTIPGTFNAYAGPFRALGIFNPFASIFAGLNYALHTYGSLAALNRAGGYAMGTNSASPGWAYVGEHGRELINFRGGERVVPNSRLGGITIEKIIINAAPLARPADIGREVVRAIGAFEKTGGSGWRK